MNETPLDLCFMSLHPSSHSNMEVPSDLLMSCIMHLLSPSLSLRAYVWSCVCLCVCVCALTSCRLGLNVIQLICNSLFLGVSRLDKSGCTKGVDQLASRHTGIRNSRHGSFVPWGFAEKYNCWNRCCYSYSEIKLENDVLIPEIFYSWTQW